MFAAAVIAEHGDTVEVETGFVDDCVPSFARPYALRVFVRRDQLVLRAKHEVTATYPDGSGVAIDRGAPIGIGAETLAWENPMLASTPVAPTVDVMTYATAPLTERATLAGGGGPRMVCDDGPPVTEGDYRAAHPVDENDFGMQSQGEWLPWCGISNGSWDYPAPTTPIPPPVLNGTPMAWPPEEGSDAHVVMTDSRFTAEVEVGCGRIRYVVQREALRDTGMMGGMRGYGGEDVDMWQPVPGPVTWPDGSPAGRYTGDYERYQHATEVGDRICVEIEGVAERVCHPKATSAIVTGHSSQSSD